uniref:Transmembrane protein n=1 Tax=Glossina austeni TaxID=7395 RepID=A0A1A9UN04_GLOAU
MEELDSSTYVLNTLVKMLLSCFLSPLRHVFLFFSYILTAAFVVPLPPLLSNPNSVHVCCIIFASHFSFGSGGGVPAIGCGLGLVTAFRLVVFVDRRGPDVDVDADGAPKPVDVAVAETKILCV